MMHTTSSRNGFTLVETLVAITILTMTIAGPLYSIQQSITASYAARDNLIASALAQEALETVYGIRDDNYLAGRYWLAGLNGTSNGANSADCVNNSCTVDPGQNSILACASGGCAPLKLSGSNLYTQAQGFPATRFTRSIRFSQLTSTEATVTVTITWTTGHSPYTITITEHLYNWL